MTSNVTSLPLGGVVVERLHPKTVRTSSKLSRLVMLVTPCARALSHATTTV